MYLQIVCHDVCRHIVFVMNFHYRVHQECEVGDNHII